MNTMIAIINELNALSYILYTPHMYIICTCTYIINTTYMYMYDITHPTITLYDSHMT